MSYADGQRALQALRGRIAEIRAEMRTVQAAIEPEPVRDYALRTADGERPLSSWFAGRRDLIVIHNMGRSCPYCTLWADGFSGVYDHLANRAGFVVTSPDAPVVQHEFAASRGWRFPMASHAGTTFAADMGYRREHGWLPGVSIFQMRGSALVRVSDTGFEPHDDFCAVWPLFEMFPEGVGDWTPRFTYRPG